MWDYLDAIGKIHFIRTLKDDFFPLIFYPDFFFFLDDAIDHSNNCILFLELALDYYF